MDIDRAALDRHVTGNWGEDSVTPDYITARELGDFEMDQEIVIDATAHTAGDSVTVTVEKVSITSGMVYVQTKELAWPLVIPEEATVWFAGE